MNPMLPASLIERAERIDGTEHRVDQIAFSPAENEGRNGLRPSPARLASLVRIASGRQHSDVTEHVV